MISSLRGTVLIASGGSVVVEVGGVGYAVAVTPQHAATLREGPGALLHTALIVREDELSLFGFFTIESNVFSDAVLVIGAAMLLARRVEDPRWYLVVRLCVVTYMVTTGIV